MNNQKMNSVKLFLVLLAITSTTILLAQSNPQKLLVRDSLDYKDNRLTVNTKDNEFSPIPFKGGLLYISNKPSLGRNNKYNRVYWSSSPKFNIIAGVKTTEKDSLSIIKLSRLEKTDDYTAPTSNDNDILANYKIIKKRFNKVEQEFITFSTDQAFAYDDSTKKIIYAKQRKAIFSKVPYWKLFQAYVYQGRLRNKQKIVFKDNNADYLYPFIDSNGARLYFASNKKGGLGGYDIYYVTKDGEGFSSNPIPVNELNSSSDDIAYFKSENDLYFSSNRPGGMGGFDVYSYNKPENEVKNLGYPLNTTRDEVSFKRFNNDFFLTTNRKDNFDIYGAEYAPIFYTINSLLVYKNDSTLVPNHSMYYMDGDIGKTIDTLVTDSNAKFSFIGKPNRNYVFTTLNGDSLQEQFSIVTVAGQQSFDYINAIGGRSPKQIADSLENLLRIAEQRRLDSIAALGIANKYIVHYNFDKSTFSKKEKSVLDYLLTKLKEKPDTYIAIGAFTDCIGSNKYNYTLSVKRAKAVYAYLIKQGLPKNRILTNGYAKKYNVAPCIVKATKNSIKVQSDSRRAEVVLTNEGNQSWETLEKTRGANYYKVINATSKVVVENSINLSNNKKTVVKIEVSNKVAKKETAPVTPSAPASLKKNEVVANTTIIKPVENSEISKDEIIKALDSLAKLKVEQERIVAYLTLRMNNKPIDIYVSSDSVSLELYDNGVHDNDSVSIIYNKRIIVDRKELKVNKPIKFKLKVDANMKNNELIMVAENLGTEPPNTAVLFIKEKSGKQQQVFLNTDMTHNGVVYFIRIGKQ